MEICKDPELYVPSFNLDGMLDGVPARAKTWCPSFISFSISKERAVVNSNFPVGGQGNFYVCERMAPPCPRPSHLRTVLPRNTCLLQLKPVQIESPGSGASLQMPHYSTIFIPHLSDGCGGLGMLQPRKAGPWP